IIFEMFRQASNPSARRLEGTGLGLYLTRRFVEQLGGSVAVESAASRGSVFTITVPRIKLPTAGRVAGPSTQSPDEKASRRLRSGRGAGEPATAKVATQGSRIEQPQRLCRSLPPPGRVDGARSLVRFPVPTFAQDGNAATGHEDMTAGERNRSIADAVRAA